MIVRNVDDVINVVWVYVNVGVDLIKICVNNMFNNISLIMEEMKVIVKMVYCYDKKVIVYVIFNLVVWEVVMVGVDGIEYGYEILDMILVLMVEKGVVLVFIDIFILFFYKLYDIIDFKWNWEFNLKWVKDCY